MTFLEESPLGVTQNSREGLVDLAAPFVASPVIDGRLVLAQAPVQTHTPAPTDRFKWAYFWLVMFFLVYFGRPEDWLPGLSNIPLAKIAGIFALVAFALSIGRMRRSLPREMICLILLFAQLWLSVPLSPVWIGGAFYRTLDFSKVLLIMLVMNVAVTTLGRLHRLIFVHTACAGTIALVTLIKGNLRGGRLVGVINGDYSNSNDLALSLLLVLPFCLAFLINTHNWWRKAIWAATGMVMAYVVLLTGSRGGLLGLLVSGGICLFEFGIKQKRKLFLLLAGAAGLATILLAGDTVKDRFNSMFLDLAPNTMVKNSAYASAVQRRELFWTSITVTLEHPLFGIGAGNFSSISGNWHDQHNSYTQVSSEGGLPAIVLYLFILGSAFKNLRDTRKLAPARSVESILAAALRGSLGGFLIGSWFASVAYQFFPYLLVGYTSTLVALVKRRAIHPGDVGRVDHLS